MFGWLFKSKPKAAPDGPRPAAEAIAEAQKLAKLAIRLVKGGQGFSTLGGLPWLPEGVVWPHRDEKPMPFLAQIDFAELPPVALELGLPADGVLFAFGSFTTGCHFVYGATGACPVAAPKGLRKPFGGKSLHFDVVASLPDPSAAIMEAWGDEEAVFEDYNAFYEEAQGDEPTHQIGGYPKLINGDHMAKLGDDWLLLLQVDSDDDTGMNWGDGGILYLWIRKADLAARDFTAVRFEADCY